MQFISSIIENFKDIFPRFDVFIGVGDRSRMKTDKLFISELNYKGKYMERYNNIKRIVEKLPVEKLMLNVRIFVAKENGYTYEVEEFSKGRNYYTKDYTETFHINLYDECHNKVAFAVVNITPAGDIERSEVTYKSIDNNHTLTTISYYHLPNRLYSITDTKTKTTYKEYFSDEEAVEIRQFLIEKLGLKPAIYKKERH